MKRRTFWFLLLSMLCFPVLLLAAEGDPAPDPGTPFNIWTYIIPFATPVIVMGVKWLTPKIPNLLVVTLAPMIAVAISAITAAMGSGGFSPLTGVALGLMAVGLRELGDQLKQTVQGIAGTPAASATYVAAQKANLPKG